VCGARSKIDNPPSLARPSSGGETSRVKAKSRPAKTATTTTREPECPTTEAFPSVVDLFAAALIPPEGVLDPLRTQAYSPTPNNHIAILGEKEVPGGNCAAISAILYWGLAMSYYGPPHTTQV